MSLTTQWDIHTCRRLHGFLANNPGEAVDLGTITLHGIEVTEPAMGLVKKVVIHFAQCGEIVSVFYPRPDLLTDFPDSGGLVQQTQLEPTRATNIFHVDSISHESPRSCKSGFLFAISMTRLTIQHGSQLVTVNATATSHSHFLQVTNRIINSKGWVSLSSNQSQV